MLDVETAWVAGIIEGEGCIGYYPSNRGYYLGVEMKDRDILDRLSGVTGVGTVITKPARRNSAETYLWSVKNKAGVVLVCESILPYMGVRRTTKIKEVLAHAGR